MPPSESKWLVVEDALKRARLVANTPDVNASLVLGEASAEALSAVDALRAAADRLADAAFQVADEQIWIGQAVGRRHRYVNALVEWRLAALHSALAAYRKLKGDEAGE